MDPRVLEIGTKDHTLVLCLDGPGAGGACHEYEVLPRRTTIDDAQAGIPKFARVSFQNGPIKEAGGVNGCFNEDLIAIVIDRLQHFQAGPFRCRENALALTKLEEALHWLNHRTQERKRYGVEGTHKHRPRRPEYQTHLVNLDNEEPPE